MRQMKILVATIALLWQSSSWLYAQGKSSVVTDHQTQEVIAEGVGITADEAIKDAYRNAVRQVVGAVVDAETLIENDELIDDKVLTYSNGFIKTSETIAGSEKLQGGLHRIKIKAQVERKGVIAKLKAANITTKKMDGKGLFAEAVTQIEAETDATDLVRKALTDLPTLLTATVDGKPVFDRTTSEVVVRVLVETDQKAYAAFVKTLDATLSKVSLSKKSVVLKGFSDPNRRDGLLIVNDANVLYGPAIPGEEENAWCLWVCSSASGQNQTLRWTGYVLPGDPKASFVPFLMPVVKQKLNSYSGPDTNSETPDTRQRLNSGITQLTVKLMNADGEIVTEDERELTINADVANGGQAIENRLPMLRYALIRQRSGGSQNGLYYTSLPDFEVKKKSSSGYVSIFNGYAAPFSFVLRIDSSKPKGSLVYSPVRIVECRFKITPGELKEVTDIVCEINYTP